MKKILCLMVLLLSGIFLMCSCADKSVRIVDYKLINPSDSNELLHVSFQLDDFYNPFLTRRENENFKKNFPQKNIKIIAVYEPIMDKTGSVIKKTDEKNYHTFMQWESDETVYNKINRFAFATNLHVNRDSQIINFDIPKPVQNKKQHYVLKGIFLYYPDFHSSTESFYSNKIDTVKYIPIFYNIIDINKVIDYKDRFTFMEPLSLEIETDKFVESSSEKIMVKNSVLKTSVWFENDKPLEKDLLSEEQKIDLFDSIEIFKDRRIIPHDEDKVDITIPDSMLNRTNIEISSGSYFKGKTYEVLHLVGQTSKYGVPKWLQEIWIRQNGDLLYITHFSNYGCELGYNIIFEKESHPRRYIDYGVWLKLKEDKTEIRKTYITPENLNFFEKIKQEKEEYYARNLKQITDFYTRSDKRDPGEKRVVSDRENEDLLKNKASKRACMREIDDMKRLFATPKEELNQQFKIYKKTINR